MLYTYFYLIVQYYFIESCCRHVHRNAKVHYSKELFHNCNIKYTVRTIVVAYWLVKNAY